MTSIQEYINITTKDVKHINCGGCGFFAKYFGEKLSDLGFNVKYIILTHDKKCVSEIKKYTKEDDTLGVLYSSWTHILLLVNNKYYVDAKGINKNLKEVNQRDKMNRYAVEINEKILTNMLKPDYVLRWNSVFDRVNCLKKLIKNIKTIK